MKFLGALRVKDESRWIENVIKSIQPLCDKIYVLDDHSTDDTPEICERLGCTVYRSHFEGLNEIRDKNWLLQKIWAEERPMPGPESQTWIVMVDGDEELEPAGPGIIRQACQPGVHALVLPIVYLWDRPDQVRTDGVYGRFSRLGRGSVFRVISPFHGFGKPRHRNRNESNFHCGSIPFELMHQSTQCRARLLHWGYIDREDRIRKYHFYNERDPNNPAEDGYRHVVQGDIPEVPATWRQGCELMHAGPLKLEPLVL